MATKKKPDVEHIPPTDKSGKWTYRYNDELVTEQVFHSIMKDHAAWVAEQERIQNQPEVPEKKRKRK